VSLLPLDLSAIAAPPAGPRMTIGAVSAISASQARVSLRSSTPAPSWGKMPRSLSTNVVAYIAAVLLSKNY